jgi:NhaP-type Na+/H+ or K+/H+ antiporter
MRVLLEGESLLNDASGLTLFEVFFHIVSEGHSGCAGLLCVASMRDTSCCCARA